MKRPRRRRPPRRRRGPDLGTLTRARIQGAKDGARMLERMVLDAGPDAALFRACAAELRAIAASPERCAKQAHLDLLRGTFAPVFDPLRRV